MNKIILLRHPETMQNIANVQQTFDSSEFTEKGEKQFVRLKEYVQNLNISEIYSSDSPRCEYVAKEIQKLKNCSLTITENLRDKSNGDFEGIPNSQIDWSGINKQAFELRKAPNGESLTDVKNRLENIFNKFVDEDKTIMLITHSVPVRLLIGLCLNLSLEQSIFGFKIENCSLNIIKQKDEKFVLEKLNLTL